MTVDAINSEFLSVVAQFEESGSLNCFDRFINRFTRPLDSDLAAYSANLLIDFIDSRCIEEIQPKFQWWMAFTYCALNSGKKCYLDKASALQVDAINLLQNYKVESDDDIRIDYPTMRTSQALAEINLCLYIGRFERIKDIILDYFEWILSLEDRLFFRWSVYQSSFAYQKMIAWVAILSNSQDMIKSDDINNVVDLLLITPLVVDPGIAARMSPAPLWWITQDHCASQYLAFKTKRYLTMLEYDLSASKKRYRAKMALKLIMSAIRPEGDNSKNLILEKKACEFMCEILSYPMLDLRQRVRARDPWETCVGLWDVPLRDTDNPASSFKDYPQRPANFAKGRIKVEVSRRKDC